MWPASSPVSPVLVHASASPPGSPIRSSASSTAASPRSRSRVARRPSGAARITSRTCSARTSSSSSSTGRCGSTPSPARSSGICSRPRRLRSRRSCASWTPRAAKRFTRPSSTSTRPTETATASARRGAICWFSASAGSGDRLGFVLELHEPDRAFEALEDYLEGFWGRDGLVADLYLGYGLSASIRRDDVPGPPEPCPLPLLACRVRPAHARERVSTVGYEVGDWERSWDDDGYAAAIELVRAAIARGDVYQVNLVQHLAAPFAGDPWALALALRHLRPLRPRPFAGHGWTIV